MSERLSGATGVLYSSRPQYESVTIGCRECVYIGRDCSMLYGTSRRVICESHDRKPSRVGAVELSVRILCTSGVTVVPDWLITIHTNHIVYR